MSDYLSHITAVGAGILIGFFLFSDLPQRTHECNFDRIAGKFTVTERELRADRSIIIVTGQDGRQHSFNRRSLRVCHET